MQLRIKTPRKKSIVDITDTIDALLSKQGVEEGVCVIAIKHTTAAITTADLDPGTDLDMLDAFEEIMPKLHYRHPHNPPHVVDHILTSIIGTSITLPIIEGHLDVGVWQRVIIVELDGPREREVVVKLLKTID